MDIRHTPRRRRGLPRIVAAIVLMIAPGCNQPTAKEVKQISDAEREFREGNYPASISRLNAYIAKFPDHADTAEAYYLRSLCNTYLGNKVQAESDARQCIRLAKNPDLNARAHATLATLLYEANRTSEALGAFKIALAGMPDRSPKDLLKYRYGLCLQREGRWAEARTQFAEVFSKYPGTETSQNARRMNAWKHDFFSIQCGAFRDRGSADDQAAKLKAKGLAAWVDARTRTGETIYSVLVGRHPSYKPARDALAAVQRHVRDAIIVP